MQWITWSSSIKMALATVREAKMRSFLTVLGVIIGTGTIIGVGSIISGLDHAISEILRQFGPNTMIVRLPCGPALAGGVEAQASHA
jgi:putative ABC transport system permease protein